MGEAGARERHTTGLATIGVLVAWCLLAVGDSRHEGEFSSFSLICVVLGLAIVAAVVAAGADVAVPTPLMLALPATVAVIAAIAHPVGRYMDISADGETAVKALVVATALVTLASLAFPGAVAQKVALATIAALALTTAVVVIRAAPAPAIDVWVLLQQSSSGLLHGLDMYRQHWQNSNGLQDVYPYLPATTVLLAPFKWVLGDVRYGLTTAALVGMYLTYRLAPKAPAALAALIVIAPHWAFLIDQSWTEPLLVAALAGAVLALDRGHPWYAVIALALALACKQHIAVLLPLFAVWPSFGLRRTLAAAALAAAIVAPWIIAGGHALWHDAVTANLDLGVQTRALNLPSLFLRHGHLGGFWFLLVALAGAYALALTRLPRTPSGLALGAALIMWTLDVANKQTYFNHYTLPLGLLVVSLAAARPVHITANTERGRERQTRTECIR